MKKLSNNLSLALYGMVAFLSIGQSHALASEEESPFSGGVSIGLEHDNRLSVQEVDVTSNESDTATLIDLDLNYDIAFDDETDLTLTYNLSQSLHDDFDQFDIQSHFLSADVKHKFGSLDGGLAYRFINTSLDNKGFLVLQQVSPYVSKFFGKKVYARADYTYTNKEFDDTNTRDADAHSLGGDLYYFVDGTNTYFIVGYKYKNENTKDSQFDYDSHNIKIKFIKKIKLGNFETKFKAGWRLESRDYSSVTASIGKKRDDNRQQYKLEWKVPFSKKFYGQLEYDHSIYSSNLPVADYSQDVMTASVGYNF